MPATLTISWYQMPEGGDQTAAKRTVVATGRRTFRAAGAGTLTLRLTGDGRKLLQKAATLKLSAAGVLTPLGGNPVSATKAFSLTR